jgi:glutathione S-transferase
MELYGSYTSPFVRHCRIALLESDLAFNFVETDAVGSAKLSPMQKVPFLKYTENGKEKMLTDSSAILKLIREHSPDKQGGKPFFADVERFNSFCSANTLMDTAINLFYLERDGITAEQSAYVKRQQSRLQTGLAELNRLKLAPAAPYDDAELRIACFLDWALFRNRITLDGFPNLQAFLDGIRQYPSFTTTVPKG